MDIKRLSRKEVIDLIKPHGTHGDKKIHDVFVKSTTQENIKQLTREEVRFIIIAARDNGGVSEHEAQCLYNILNYIGIANDAREYLRRFLRESKVNKGKKEIIPMTSNFEKQKIQIISQASRIPVQFVLPKRADCVYKFSEFKVIAGLLDRGDISMFAYKGDAYGEYRPGLDCLIFNNYPKKEHNIDSTIIHEATHAIQDVKGWDATIGHTEAAAHLAQAVWLLYYSNPLLGKKLDNDAIRLTAKRILSKMPSKNGDKLVTVEIKQIEYDGILKVLKDKGAYDITKKAAPKSGDKL